VEIIQRAHINKDNKSD